MALGDVERITAFERRFGRAQATEVVEFGWGFSLLQGDFPYSHFHNRLVVTSEVSAAAVIAAADEVLGGAGLTHRYVSVDDDEVGRALRADMEAVGYSHEAIVAMVYRSDDPDPPEHEVSEVTLESVWPAIVRDWRIELPNAADEVLDQLAGRTALHSRAAEVALLAVFDGAEIAAHAHLYMDRTERIAQFENLVTSPDFRRRGYGTSLVREALRRSRQAGCELSFLTADVGGWPHDWYTRMGYVDTCQTHHFQRTA